MPTSVQNRRGEWVPAIPLPYFLTENARPFRWNTVRCECGAAFHSQRRYREHYALVHVLGLN